MRTRAALFFVIVIVTSFVYADPPSLTFSAGGVSIGGVRPGTKLVWLGMIRERVDAHVQVRFVRGLQPATPAGKIDVPEQNADQARAVWVVADVDSGTGRKGAAPGFLHSAAEIVIRATAGQPAFAIESAAVELLYVRPHRGAWSFGAGDSSERDADHESDGTIVVSLSSLRRFEGNPHPPDVIEPGDLILVIDPYRIRTAQMVVPQ
jgi:hypothetical protein